MHQWELSISMLLAVFIYLVAICKAAEKGLKHTKSPAVVLPALKLFTIVNIIESSDRAQG